MLDRATGGPLPPVPSGHVRVAIEPSTAWGPISTIRSTPREASVSMLGAKATGSRVCRRQ